MERIGVEAIWRDAGFEAGIKRYNNALEQAERAIKCTEYALKRYKDNLEEVEEKEDRKTRSGLSLIQSFADIKGVVDIATGVLGRFAGYLNQVFQAAAEGAQQIRSARAFYTLVGGVEEARAVLEKLREATNGTVSDQGLMEQATMLLSLRVARTSEELATAARSITAVGGAIKGLSAERAIMSFVLLTSNFEASKARLDDFGLTLADVKPKIDAYVASGMAMQEAIRVSLLEAVNEKFEQLGGGAVDAATQFGRLRAQQENLSNGLKQALAPATAALIEGFLHLTQVDVAGFFALVEESAARVAGVLHGLSAMVSRVYEMTQPIELIKLGAGVRTGDMTQALEPLRAYTEAFMETYNRAHELSEQTNQVAEGAGVLGRAFDDASESTWNAAEATSQYTKRLVDLQTRGLEQLVEMSIQAGRQREDDALARARRLEDLERNLAQRRAQIVAQSGERMQAIERQYTQSISQAQQQYNDNMQRAQQDYARRLENIEYQHQERMRQIRERFDISFQDAVRRRDALALVEAIRTRQREEQNAQGERDRQRAEAAADYQRQQAEQAVALQRARETARAAREQQLADLRANLEQQNAAIEADRERQLAEMQLAEERQRQDREIANRRKLEDMQRQFVLERAQADAAYLGQEEAYRAHLMRMLTLTDQFIPRIYRRIPAPGGGVMPVGHSGIPGFAEGGAMIVTRPTLARFGEAGAELVSAIPLSGGKMRHDVSGTITAQMAGLSGQLTAAVQAAVIEAFREVVR